MHAVFFAACFSACGARSELIIPSHASDASGPDAGDPFEPIECGVPIAAGDVRYVIEQVVGRGASDPQGNVYVPVALPSGERAVRSVDACGRLRWETPVLTGGRFRGGKVRRATDGEILLTDVQGDRGIQPVMRLDSDGHLLGSIHTDTIQARTIAVPTNDGPIVATVDAANLTNQIERFSVSGVREQLIGDWSNANECAVASGLIACHDRAWDIAANRLLWSHPFEILDGTLRHIVGTSIADGRVYSLLFGISTFVLDAIDTHSGRTVWRLPLAQTTAGQRDMLASAPVVRDDGEIFVYLHATRSSGANGQLVEVSPAGALVRSFAADSRTEYFDEAGSVAIGADGTVFLAVGNTVRALDRSFTPLWTHTETERVDSAWSMLTTRGDLLVHTESDRLLAIASGSPGISRAGWPLASGDARNANAR